jgi:D-alanine-D-alanine ligase
MKIAIITGGITGEREVSISSAKNIQTLLDKQASVFVFPEDEQKFMSEYANFDVVIPMIHGRGAEDGELQHLLEVLNIPYLFSKPSAHAIGLDKVCTKEVAVDIGIPVAKSFTLETAEFPVFVKPQHGGSSVAAGVCNSVDDVSILMENVDDLFLIEEIIKGREFTVGIVEINGQAKALPVTEIISEGFFDYESKYNPDKLATEICPANIDDTLRDLLQHYALSMHAKLNCKHISRSDFIVTDEGKVVFLEINTIPGETETSLIPNMLQAAELDFTDLIRNWCSEVVKK